MLVRKNIGPAGLTLVIVRDDLLDQSRADIPSLLKYSAQAKNDSMVNTPATYSWYLAGLVFEWLKSKVVLRPFIKPILKSQITLWLYRFE